jgi:hypothetical protein
MARFAKRCFLIVLVVTASGCALNRSLIDTQMRIETLVNPNGKQVYIRSIVDNRQFQEKPPTPDIPSLGFGELKDATQELKSRAVGRKRNTYGKALGDIMLSEGQSVQKTVYEATRNAWHSLGYAVVDKQEDAKPDAILMDISIDKFWSYLSPGFWALTLKSEITTTNTISLSQKDNPTVIMATAEESFQVASDTNWEKVLMSAINNFTTEAKTKFHNFEQNPGMSVNNKAVS